LTAEIEKARRCIAVRRLFGRNPRRVDIFFAAANCAPSTARGVANCSFETDGVSDLLELALLLKESLLLPAKARSTSTSSAVRDHRGLQKSAATMDALFRLRSNRPARGAATSRSHAGYSDSNRTAAS
jgi:phosphoenolpyruvate carboxylase